MNIAVIPARGGSKRIPRKNIKEFHGKPIIAWSIEAAVQSGCFTHIIVSTDDEEIAEVARSYGAKVPFMRPAELADDYTGTVPVIKHAVEWFEEHEGKIYYVCCIYPTAPFVMSNDIIKGHELITKNDCDYVITVTMYNYPIQRALKIDRDGYTNMFYPEKYETRSQDLEEAYHDAGQFYWGKAEAWKEQKPVLNALSLPVVLPNHRVQDIDTLQDWKRAELLFYYAHDYKE